LCAQVIEDYTTPEGKSLSRDLTHHVNNIVNFLVECRPLSVSMGNAIKFLKLRISQVLAARSSHEGLGTSHMAVSSLQSGAHPLSSGTHCASLQQIRSA
jgi:translation initiation factor 2B subunit (eIF-2B alpha/beta/delta family)